MQRQSSAVPRSRTVSPRSPRVTNRSAIVRPARPETVRLDRVVLRLIVFSDDWGRHPSSCQHLVRHLLERIPVLWVDTIGMRSVALSRQDLRKVFGRLDHWLRPSRGGQRLPSSLTLIAPPMWPGFRTTLQRRLNARLVARAVNRALRSEEHTSELQSQSNLVCRLLLEKKKKTSTTLPVRTFK